MELRCCLQELQEMIIQLDHEASPAHLGPGSVPYVELQRQIANLMEENARLSGLPPPAYKDDFVSE
jgi:hypothetical protein